MPKGKKQPKDLADVITPEEDEPEDEDPILDEIEEIFDKIKEREITVSQAEEYNEMTISNLVVAYYLNKLGEEIEWLKGKVRTNQRRNP